MKETRFGRLVFIPGLRDGRYPFCNSLFIDDERKALIDPASDESVLKDLGLKKGVDTIINSHYHEDHIAFNYLFPESELQVHEAIAPCFQSYEVYLDYCGLLHSKYRKEWDHLYLKKFNFRERTPDVQLKDGDTLTFGRTKAKVIYTPGHTIGHCSFHFPDEGVLFLGDYGLNSFGPWYGDRVSDIDQTIESVFRLTQILADTYITSHEMGVIKGSIASLSEQYLDVIGQRDRELMAFLEEPRTFHEIANRWIIFKEEMQPRYFFEFAEEEMIRKHLERLMRGDRVGLTKGQYSLT